MNLNGRASRLDLTIDGELIDIKRRLDFEMKNLIRERMKISMGLGDVLAKYYEILEKSIEFEASKRFLI